MTYPRYPLHIYTYPPCSYAECRLRHLLPYYLQQFYKAFLATGGKQSTTSLQTRITEKSNTEIQLGEQADSRVSTMFWVNFGLRSQTGRR